MPLWAWLALVSLLAVVGAAVRVVVMALRDRCGRGHAYAEHYRSSRVEP